MANGIILFSLFVITSVIFAKGNRCGSEVTTWPTNEIAEESKLLFNETDYCFVDEYTIRIKKSNVLLDIINKSNDCITATNSTNFFTIPVTSNNSVAYCSIEDDPNVNYFIFSVIISFIIIISSSLNIVLHLIVKELRSTPGYIIIGICGTTILIYLSILITAIFQYLHTVNGNTAICGVFKYMMLCFIITYTMLKATYLFHFAFLMYRSYISHPYEEKNKKLLYIYVVVNAAGTTVCSALIITLDQIRYRNALDTSNGYCTSHFFNEVGTSDYLYDNYIYVLSLFSTLTAIGIVFLIIGLTLYYLITKRCCACSSMTGPSDVRVSLTLTSATALGALILVVLLLAGFNEDVSVMAGNIGICVEQVILLIAFLTSTKTQDKLKKYFYRRKTIDASS